MGERRDEAARRPGAGLYPEFRESSSLLQTAVSVLQNSYLDSTSQDGFWYSQAILVENDVFLNELKAFVQAKEAAGYSQEELEETFAFLLFDNEEEAKEVCQTGLRVNSSSISMLGDPAKGVYISKYADCLHPRPWYHGKSGFIVICKLIKGKVKVVSENYTTSYTCPSPGYDCHVAMSTSIMSSKSSPCQAFEQNQYYVYEVSEGSTAERPRQICPYIVIACQYREPKEMPILARESLPEPNHKGLYCPWRGQLSIQGQLLCNIALRTPYSSTIPAQLPHNLDINHVMGLSDLKKKLPEAAFGKRNYIENEVCFQGVYFSLYEVEISNKDQHKMDQLLENLRKRDLAIIKYLQDHGVLILLTSSALAQDDGFDPKEPVSLLALFLFSSSRSVCLRVEGHNLKCERKASDISLKIASVLPGLRYALQKATNSSWGDALGTNVCIKQHFQEYAKLEENTQQASSQITEAPCSSCLSPAEDEGIKSCRGHSEQSFSQLQHYFSNPSSYTLEMSAALGCLAGAAQSLCSNSETDFSLAVPSDPIPPDVTGGNLKAVLGLEQSKGPTKDVSASSKLWVKQNKRKSSGTAVTSTRKKWSPLKMQIHPVGDSSRKRKATKTVNITFSFPKKTGLTANSNEPMLKLAHLQFPHRRKRGAEVLSAEFVHKTQSEPVQKRTSAPSSSGSETKRPKMLKNSDVKKAPVAESTAKPVKSQVIKSVANRPSKPHTKKPAESEWKDPFSILPSEVSSQSQAADSQMGEIYPSSISGHAFDTKGSDYESHALNLLADLALGSCIPPFNLMDSRMISLSCSSSTDSAKEQQSHRKPKSSRSASDHEYHRVDKLAKAAVSSTKASPNQKLPPIGKTELKDSTPIPGEKSLGLNSKNSQQTCVLPPTQEATEVNKHSFISSEHSYASLMPEHSKKHRGVPYPGSVPSRNGTRSSRAAPLVGKVLPFRHQNNTCPQSPFEATMARRRSSLRPPRLKEDFAKSHTVNHCGESMKVTCQWEEEYLFHLDSRYTNDALEKTVIRALHGPWDSDLPDDVEEMKLILHMWVALFYSKPSKLLSSTRKVVEHSNPKKYVSLNSTGDFFELSEDSDDCFELETCPADSRSDPDQTPSSSLDPSTHCQGCFHPEESPADSQTDADGTPGVVDSTVSSFSGEEEPSSTSSESPSLTEHADQSNLAGKYRAEECVHDISTVTAVEPLKEELMDAGMIPSPSNELGDAGEPQTVLGRENPHGQTLNFSPAPQSDALCAQHGGGEQPENRWAGGPSPPEERGSMEDAGHGMDSSWATSDGPQRCRDSMPSEASLKTHSNPIGFGEEEKESQDPVGHTEKEEEKVEEGKREKEELENESTFARPVDLAFSERGDVELVNSAPPKDFGIPGDGPMFIPTASVLPCENGSVPAPSGGTGAGPQGLSGDAALSLSALQEPWGTLATPRAETDGVGLAHADGPVSVLPLSPVLSLVHGVTITSSCRSAREMLRDGLEQKDEDRAPSAETLGLAGSKTACTTGPESPRGQEPFLTQSPDASSVCFDGGADVGAALGDQVATALLQAFLQTPPRSGPGGSLSQRCAGDVSTELTLLNAGESHPDQNEVLEQGQRGSPSANHTDVLDEPSGACDGQGFAFSCAAWAGGSDTEAITDVCLYAEKPPSSNEMSVVDAPQELKTSLCDLLESGSSSSMREEEPVGDVSPLTVAQHQQSSPNSPSLPSPHQDPSHGTAADPHCCLLEQSEQEPDLCPHGKPCKTVAAVKESVAAENPALDGSLKPECAEGVKKDLGLCHAEPAESSPLDMLTPGEPGSRPCSPLCGHKAEPDPVFGTGPKMSPTRAPDAAPSSSCMGQLPSDADSRCACPGSPEECEGGSSIPPTTPASFGAGEFMPVGEPASLCSQDDSAVLADPNCADEELEEGEIPVQSMPTSLLRADTGESLEVSDTGDILDALLKAKRFPSTEKCVGLSWEDPSYRSPSSDSNWEKHLGRTAHPLLTPRGCHCSRSMGATRTDCDSSSSMSSGCSEGFSEEWGSLSTEEGYWWPTSQWNTSSRHMPPYVNITDSWGISRDYLNFTVTTKCPGRMGSSQGQTHLLESLMGTWRDFEEITQHTMDMEHLRFHYKLKQILRSGTPPISTSVFPRDCSPQPSSVQGAPAPHSLRSRSPLQVTILPSDTRPRGLKSHQQYSHHRDSSHCTPSWDTCWWQKSRASSPNRGCAAPFHLSKLKYENKLKDSRGDISVILDEYAEFNRVMLSKVDTEGESRGKGLAHGETVSARRCTSLPRRTAAFEDVISELCSTLQFRLRSVAEEACRQPGMFYLVETGEEPFFARVKTLLKKDGHVEIEPLSFCRTKHQDTNWLLVIIRNEDISSHIHKVPCLLRLKHCPNVVFAGVDSPEDIADQTYQELFHTGGFVVSDSEVLEMVTLGQLKEVVKVLEKLNRSGRWKWFLHYKESKKLRENVRVDANAHRKNLILKSCQDLIEVLHYHACDSSSSPRSEYMKCLLNLQVQHVSARFAVYLTEKPSVSRDVLENKGILVADISTFLGMAQKVAAPFRSCW